MSEAEPSVATHETRIPAAVQKQLDEINAKHEEAKNAKSAEQAPEQGNTEETAPVLDVNTVIPAPNDFGPTPLTAQDETSEAVETAEKKPEPTDISTLPDDIQKRLHAYDVLKGKYSAEVPDLQSQLRKANAKAEMLEEELEKAKKAETQYAPAPAGQVGEVVTPDMITDDDIAAAGITQEALDDYGKEYWQLTIASQRNQLRPYMQQVQQMQAQATPEQAAKEEATFLTSLDSLTPEWRDLNNDRNFQRWLDGTDPVYGIPYIDMLNDAANDNDAIRASAIFSLYKQHLAQHAPTVPSPPHTVQQPVNLPSVQSQVAPSTVPQGPAQGKKIYHIDEWKQMMNNLTNGEYTPERAAELHKELMAAVREKRFHKPS